MGFLRGLFGGAPAKEPEASVAPDARHSVAVWVRLFDAAFENEREQLATFALEDRLMAAMDASGAGTFDTNDLERGAFGMHFAGPDADAMIAVLQPLLEKAPPGSYLAVRRGPPGTSQERIDL